MIRLSFLVWLVLIASAGAGLYFLKYRVIELESTLASVNRDIAANREAVAWLNAEWSFLNDPDDIAAYAEHYLDTRPAGVGDIVAMSDIPLARGRAEPAAPSRRAPDGSTPPPPPMTPLRAPPPGAEPAPPDPQLLASGDDAPAPELSLVPAAEARSDTSLSAQPEDSIGRLIADVLQPRADASPAAGGARDTAVRGIAR